MYKHITLKDLRPRLPKIIQEVDSELKRYIISKRGKPVAVLLSTDDFNSLLETLNEESDRKGVKRIRKGFAEAKAKKTVAWEQLKKELNIYSHPHSH